MQAPTAPPGVCEGSACGPQSGKVVFPVLTPSPPQQQLWRSPQRVTQQENTPCHREPLRLSEFSPAERKPISQWNVSLISFL